MNTYRRGFAAIALLGVVATPPTATVAQVSDAVEARARTLYEAAAYEEALTLLDNATQPPAQKYRALCLLALGRQSDAKATLEALVTAAPDFAVGEDVPPRFVTMLDQARAQLLPSILRGLLTEGRQHYQAQEYEQARPVFERMVALTSHAGIANISGVADLQLLAEGYLDLLRDAQPRPRVAATEPVAAPPTPAPAPEIMTPPVAIRQIVPPWPADVGQIERARVGLLHLRISAKGEVLSATVIRSVHPRYDPTLVTATKRWQYTPATRNGIPVEAESTIEVRPQTSYR